MRSTTWAAFSRAQGIVLKRHGEGLLGLCPLHEDRRPSLSVSPDEAVLVLPRRLLCERQDHRRRRHRIRASLLGRQLLARPSPVSGPRPPSTSRARPCAARRRPAARGASPRPVRSRARPRRRSSPASSPSTTRPSSSRRRPATTSPRAASRSPASSRPCRSATPTARFSRRPPRAARRGRHCKVPRRPHGCRPGASLRLRRLPPARPLGHGRQPLRPPRREADRPHLFLPGPRRGLVNAACAATTDELILTESVIDALSFLEAGLPNAVPLYGTNGWTPDHDALLERHCIRRVVLALDADEAGRTASRALFEKLRGRGIEVTRRPSPSQGPERPPRAGGPDGFAETWGRLVTESAARPARRGFPSPRLRRRPRRGRGKRSERKKRTRRPAPSPHAREDGVYVLVEGPRTWRVKGLSAWRRRPAARQRPRR